MKIGNDCQKRTHGMIRLRIYILFLLISFSLCSLGQINTKWKQTVESHQIFSSPFLHDFNNDGIKDVLISSGNVGDYDTIYPMRLTIYEGLTGNVLASGSGYSSPFSTPRIYDINNDNIDDIVISGYNEILIAYDGTDLSVLWEFNDCNISTTCSINDSVPNIFTPLVVNDVTGDGVSDLICTIGGFVPAEAADTIRPPSKLMLVNGATGDSIFSITTPDLKESYHSPSLLDFQGDSTILWGTGGETISGCLYSISLNDFLNQNLNFTKLFCGEEKGFFAPITIIHYNDCYKILSLNFGSILYSIDCNLNKDSFYINNSSHETQSNLAVGIHQDDLFYTFLNSEGLFPDYISSDIVSVQNGSFEVLSKASFPSYSSPILCDLNLDENDEILYINNNFDSIADLYSYDLMYYDLDTESESVIFSDTGSISFISTPKITDLDNNNLLDLLYITFFDFDTTYGYNLHCLNTTYPSPEIISWGGYRGTNSDDLFYFRENISNVNSDNNSFKIYPNPTENVINIIDENHSIEVICLIDQMGNEIKKTNTKGLTNLSLELSSIAKGTYTLILQTKNNVYSKKIIVY